jgi:hypothetical protein
LEILEPEKWNRNTLGKPRELLQKTPKRSMDAVSTVTLINTPIMLGWALKKRLRRAIGGFDILSGLLEACGQCHK